MTADLKCLDGPADCAGPVEYRTTPDRTDGKAFPRCEHHFDLRMGSVERNLELQSRRASRLVRSELRGRALGGGLMAREILTNDLTMTIEELQAAAQIAERLNAETVSLTARARGCSPTSRTAAAASTPACG